MAKREAVANRQYTGEFKVEAVRLAESIGSKAVARPKLVYQRTIVSRVDLAQASPDALVRG